MNFNSNVKKLKVKIDILPPAYKTLQAELENAKALEQYFISGENPPIYVTSYINEQITTIRDYVFSNWKALKNIYFPNVKQIKDNAFETCIALTEVNDKIFPNLETIGSYGFSYCTGLTKVELSKVTRLRTCTFNGCTNLTVVKLPSLVELNSNQIFQDAGIVEAIFPEVTLVNSNQVFNRCKNLETIELPKANISANLNSWFNGCTNLKNLKLYNISKGITIGSGTSWGHLLTLESLIHTIKELIKGTSSYTLTMGSANLEKLQDVYVRLTGEPEENTSKPKLPCEVCESTDEGAMSIIAYANSKNWTLA